MAGLISQLKGKPGQLLVKDSQGRARIFSLTNAYEGDKYDTVIAQANSSGVIPAGLTLEFFVDVNNKRKNQTNFSTPRKLDSGEEMLITKLGLQILPAYGNSILGVNDVKMFLSHCWMEWKINNVLIDEGFADKYASGYGLYGSTVENGTSIFSLGMPSQAAIPKLKETFYVNSDYSIYGTLHYDPLVGETAPTYTANQIFAIRAIIHGIIKRAASV
jgi:hypothetical protein